MNYVKARQIILAHGLNGEIGVPTSVNKSGLPWPRLQYDMEFFKANSAILILGKNTYEIAKKWLEHDRLLLGVSTTAADYKRIFPSLESAIAAAEQYDGDVPITIGGGTRLAAAAFQLFEHEHSGTFYETVVHGTYPDATDFMPVYDEAKWTVPELLVEYEATRETPAYHIQSRSAQ